MSHCHTVENPWTPSMYFSFIATQLPFRFTSINQCWSLERGMAKISFILSSLWRQHHDSASSTVQNSGFNSRRSCRLGRHSQDGGTKLFLQRVNQSLAWYFNIMAGSTAYHTAEKGSGKINNLFLCHEIDNIGLNIQGSYSSVTWIVTLGFFPQHWQSDQPVTVTWNMEYTSYAYNMPCVSGILLRKLIFHCHNSKYMVY